MLNSSYAFLLRLFPLLQKYFHSFRCSSLSFLPFKVVASSIYLDIVRFLVPPLLYDPSIPRVLPFWRLLPYHTFHSIFFLFLTSALCVNGTYHATIPVTNAAADLFFMINTVSDTANFLSIVLIHYTVALKDIHIFPFNITI